MKEYSSAICEEKQRRAIICYIDESLVNVRHRKRFTWFSRHSPQRNEVGGPTGKGSREIIIHSITKHGLVGGDSSADTDLSTAMPQGSESAQHCFIGGFIGDDYHKNMGDAMLLNWLKRLRYLWQLLN